MSAFSQSIYRTAESVSPDHPDKLCDRISDALLDAHLRDDPESRVAIDVAGGHGAVFVTGEVTSRAKVDVESVVKRIVGGEVDIITRLEAQSPEIAAGVDTGGAGDQGIMVGYACSETAELLPLEVVLSRQLNQHLYKQWPHDGKTQVTLRGDKVCSVVASFQHASGDKLRAAVTHWLEDVPTCEGIELHCNPAGDWSIGGFDADAGLTGRKLVVDNYGPRIPIGGGAFSGKDASKVDRSAAYMARKIAIDYLQKHSADEVFVHLAYAIGYDQPLEASVRIDGRQEQVEGYDLSPRAIAKALRLNQPVFEQTASWGHFGHKEFSWEQRT